MVDERVRLGHRPALDGLRGVAVLVVIAYHFDGFFGTGLPIYGGSLGVDLFFCLSGFLITRLLIEEWDARRSIDLRAFYVRRALRLFPAAAVALVAGFAIATTVEATRRDALDGVLYSALYVNNWVAVARDRFLGVVGHLWSLSVEEQFYVAWPLVAIAALSANRLRRWALTGAVASSMLCAGLSLSGVLTPSALYLNTFTHGAPLLLAGAAYATVVFELPIARATADLVGGASAAAFALFVARIPYTDRLLYNSGMLLPIALSLGLVLAAMHPSSTVNTLCSLRPLAAIGQVSYGLYLWHFLAAWFVHNNLEVDHALAGWLLSAALTALATIASWTLVERPALRLKRRFARSEPVPAFLEHRPPLRETAR